MDLVSLNRLVLLILMSYCIYAVFIHNKVSKARIDNLQKELENKKLDTEIKQLEIKYLKQEK